MAQATVTSKGQTTIPKAIRDFLKLKPGDRLEFAISGGKVILTAKNKRLADLAGARKPRAGMPYSRQDIDDAIERAVTERAARSLGPRQG